MPVHDASLEHLEASVGSVIQSRRLEQLARRQVQRAYARRTMRVLAEILSEHTPGIRADAETMMAELRSLVRSPGWTRLLQVCARLPSRGRGAIELPVMSVDWQHRRARFTDESGWSDAGGHYLWAIGPDTKLQLFEVRPRKWFGQQRKTVAILRTFEELANLKTTYRIGKGDGFLELEHSENQRWMRAEARAALVLCTARLRDSLQDQTLLEKAVAGALARVPAVLQSPAGPKDSRRE